MSKNIYIIFYLISFNILLAACSSPPESAAKNISSKDKNVSANPENTAQAADHPRNDDAMSQDLSILTASESLIKNYCANCHGENQSNSGGLKNITDLAQKISDGYIIPGNAENSKLYSRIVSKTSPMPPPGSKRPTEEELAQFKKWIDLGAKTSVEKNKKSFISEDMHLREIASDILHSVPVEADRKNYRYLSLVAAQNGGATEETLNKTKQAVAKLLNSLSKNPSVFRPEISKTNPLLIRFKLDDVGWRKETWAKLEKSHPYQIIPKDTRVLGLLQKQLDTPQPVLRADWFVAHCSQPPLYFEILELPKTQAEFEKQLSVNFVESAQKRNILRAGFNNSEVADVSRVIERTPMKDNKFIWHSFEFGDSLNDKNPFDRPFGPGATFNAVKGAQQLSFNHDGKEIIFSLPNNFLGFYVANGQGTRLDSAPTRTRNSSFVTGTAIVGVACMTCHSQGLLEKRDEIRASFLRRQNISQELQSLVTQIYTEPTKFQEALRLDTQSYQDALKSAGVDFTQPDPVSAILKTFNDPVDLKIAAGELGVDETDLKVLLISNLSKVEQVSALTNNNTISRSIFSVNFQKIMEIVYDVKAK